MTEAEPTKKPRRGRPPTLRREAVVAAAIEILTDSGREALSMRVVAERLGVGKMSLYHYVSDRGELEQLIIEHLLAEIPLPSADLPWEQRLLILARDIRGLVVRHPYAAVLLAECQYRDPAALRPIEGIHRALADAGLREARLAIASRLVFGYATGFANLDHAYRHAAGPTPTDVPADPETTAPLSALPETEFPLTVEASLAIDVYTLDEQFTLSLAPLIMGLVAYADQT